MALKRIWTPTGNYSSGGKKRLIVLHTMEGFTGPNGAYDCAKYFQTDCGASSQVCIDNNRGTIWEGVSYAYGSWTQCQFNSIAVSAEQCGYASWTRDYWLNNRSNELQNTAEWVAEESRRLNIPIRALSSSEAQSGASGVCHHSQLGSSGCGHSDCGSGYPLDQVIQWAMAGGMPITPPIEEDMYMTADSAWVGETLYRVCVGWDKRIYYRDDSWAKGRWDMIDPTQAKDAVKSGAGITSNGTDRLDVSYVRHDGAVCAYQWRKDEPWQWKEVGGSALLSNSIINITVHQWWHI